MTQDDPHGLIRVMALHALAYCERLFYLEEVEEIRISDERVYAGRTLHEELTSEPAERRSFDMASLALGLVGKVDAVKHREGGWVPYEHKRGRARRGAGNEAEAWPSDALQVSAYGMLLEEFTGSPVQEGRVRYHADNVTVRVRLDERARQQVRDAVARARQLRSALQRPPVTPNERLCLRCSLAPVCLPEEERLASDPQWEPVRLFPPGQDGQVLHVVTQGARISRAGQSLAVYGDEGSSQKTFPIRDISSVVLHGNVQATTQAIHLAASHGIPIHWFTLGGKYISATASDAGGVQRRIRQFEALSDDRRRLALAKRLAMARVQGQLRYLLRGSRGKASRPPEMTGPLGEMRAAMRAIDTASSVNSVRGHEGSAGRAYFQALPLLLADHVSDDLRPKGRNRRPPRDRFNALLSFGYGLLYRSVLQAILTVGLDPAFGFFHTPRSSAHPLVLDLMELFRVPVWDVAVVGSLNRKQWNPEEHFIVAADHVWLSDAGRRLAIDLYERRLQETWKHPATGYSLSYARNIELEVRLLEKEWTAQPGLFARSSIR